MAQRTQGYRAQAWLTIELEPVVFGNARPSDQQPGLLVRPPRVPRDAPTSQCSSKFEVQTRGVRVQKWMASLAVAVLAAGGARPVAAQAPSNDEAQEPAPPTPPWPRVVTSGTKTLTLYEPQAERWENNKLWASSAVVVKDSAADRSLYGVVRFTAQTDVDKTQDLASLHDVEITGADFPGDPAQASAYKKTIEDAGQLTSVISVGRLQAGLKKTEAARDPTRKGVENPLPRIILSRTPAVLVLVDGAPALRALEGTTLSRVVNTRSLMVRDASLFYLYVGSRWFQSTTLEGAWSIVTTAHPELDRAKEAVELAGLVERGEIDLLANAANDAVGGLAVYVSTTPAELIQAKGSPQVAPIHGTNLWYVTNTNQDVFLRQSSGQYYVVLSGRWYRARSLDGPWQFVDSSELPADFARIPPGSPKANVLASIPGTTQAKEALIANQIPQTAAVPRQDGPTLDVDYDGPPKFAPIEETSLQYATNTATPVVETSPTAYYAVKDGVWFAAASPTGPWVVAPSVPPSIYSIPTSSPMHYVTYVYVDGSSPGYVYDAYTPGYLGTVAAPTGTVVYGTGYDYSPWIGNYWYGGPWTYGYGAGLAVGVGFGVRLCVQLGRCCAAARSSLRVVAAPYARYNRSVHLANVDVYHAGTERAWSSRTIHGGSLIRVRAASAEGHRPRVPPFVSARWCNYPGPGWTHRAPPAYRGGPVYEGVAAGRGTARLPSTGRHRAGRTAPGLTAARRSGRPRRRSTAARQSRRCAAIYRSAPVAPAPVYRSGRSRLQAPLSTEERVFRSAPARRRRRADASLASTTSDPRFLSGPTSLVDLRA